MTPPDIYVHQHDGEDYLFQIASPRALDILSEWLITVYADDLEVTMSQCEAEGLILLLLIK
jgi:hypothetical protein